MDLKSVFLEGEKVIVAGFVSTGEIDSVMETISGSWPYYKKRVGVKKKGWMDFKKDITALVITAPTVAAAKEMAETLEILFFPITS